MLQGLGRSLSPKTGLTLGRDGAPAGFGGFLDLCGAGVCPPVILPSVLQSKAAVSTWSLPNYCEQVAVPSCGSVFALQQCAVSICSCFFP